MKLRISRLALWAGIAAGLGAGGTGVLKAHCDTLDGPVVTDARQALDSGDVTPALKWVRAGDEEEVRAAFRRTVAVRSLGPEARDMADTWFFETLVRLHRAGEGEPYSGLKPAGQVEPVVAAADEALESGDAGHLVQHLGEMVRESVQERFLALREAERHKDDSIAAGRRYVEAYVAFVHLVERLHALAAGGGNHH